MEMKLICWLNAAQFRSCHVLDQLKESSRVCAAAFNQHKRPTKRNNYNLEKRRQATALVRWPRGCTSDEGDGESGVQMCHFLIQFTAFNPSFSRRGVRFMLLFAFSSMRSYKHITRFADRGITRPRHTRPHSPTQQHTPFDLGVTMSLTAPSP
jgi:hypothetical protein